MPVNSLGPGACGGAAGSACVAWLTGVLRSADGAGGALNMPVNSLGPDACGGAAGSACVTGLTGALCSASGEGGSVLNMLVNSPAPDTRDDAGATGIAVSADGAGGGGLNMLVNSPGLDEAGGAGATGGIADRIANVSPGVAGSSGSTGENAAGIVCVPDATGWAGSGFRSGDGMRIVAVTDKMSSAGGTAAGATGVEASPPFAA